MPRIKRGLVDGYVYHVLNRGNGKQDVFHKSQDYKAFLELMKEAKKRFPVKIFAYCLMPNHFHIVVMPIYAEALSDYMQWLMTSHVRRYHSHYGTSGHIWQGRFKSFIVQKDEYLLAVLRYVESNPMRAGLTKLSKEWPWSSHKELIGEAPRLVTDQINLDLPQQWNEFVNTPLGEDYLDNLRKSVNRGSPFGNKTWQVQISNELALESTLRPRGRPRRRDKND